MTETKKYGVHEIVKQSTTIKIILPICLESIIYQKKKKMRKIESNNFINCNSINSFKKKTKICFDCQML